jgi:hypothetical protein
MSTIDEENRERAIARQTEVIRASKRKWGDEWRPVAWPINAHGNVQDGLVAENGDVMSLVDLFLKEGYPSVVFGVEARISDSRDPRSRDWYLHIYEARQLGREPRLVSVWLIEPDHSTTPCVLVDTSAGKA